MTDDCIKLGDFVVVQRQTFKKLHKINKPNTSVNLGRDTIDLTGIIGCKYYSFFKLTPKGNKKNRQYGIDQVSETKDLKECIDITISGTDNRNIVDDGRSQKLSAAEIEELKNESQSSSDIVGTLISNSSTFQSKTEFSQDKYLKKKEKKYFEYITIRKPNVRLIAEILYKLDPGKIHGIRTDVLSQIVCYSNISSNGTHLLYDSGSNGLLSATLLNAIGANTSGTLIHLHPGNMSQKQALLAANFPQEQYNRCISANVYSALRQYHQGCDINNKTMLTEIISDSSETKLNEVSRKRTHEGSDEEIEQKIPKLENENTDLVCEPKKPKWHFDTLAAAEALKSGVDSLIITSKEDPLNLFEELIKFVKPSRSFVIYYPVAEPLQQCYMSLRARTDVAAVKLTNSWTRTYQVLPDRTHPDVMMNNSGGFLLTGYTLK